MKKLIILNHSLTLNKIELYAFEEGKARLPVDSPTYVLSLQIGRCVSPNPCRASTYIGCRASGLAPWKSHFFRPSINPSVYKVDATPGPKV